jgi:hypothetical protein
MDLTDNLRESVRAFKDSLDEGAGIHSARFKRCVKKVAAKQPGSAKDAKNAAYGICTATFQKAGMFKPGTADLTAKGKNAMSDPAEEQVEAKGGKAKGGDPVKKLKNAVMGMSGGAIAAVRAVKELKPSLEKSDSGKALAVQLDGEAAQLDQLMSRMKALVAKL